jgi:hypothetical protein
LEERKMALGNWLESNHYYRFNDSWI